VALLSVEGLRTQFDTSAGAVRAVDGVSFAIERGEMLGLVGESGCGKSVTSLSIMRLVPPPGRITTGRVRLDGEDLLDKDAEAMRRVRGARMAMVFQEPMTSLNPVFTIGDQIAAAVRAHAGVGRRAAWERAVEMLDHVQVPGARERAREYPHQLSGGLRQRAMIALALAPGPELLIADEPTTALDVTIQAQILELMRRLQQDHGSSILLITHDMGVVAELAERIVVMYAGSIVEEGPRSRLFRDPQHPYTWGLLGSIPRVDRGRVRRLTAIPGAPPSMLALPPGCRFEPRCRHRFEKCSTRPELAERAGPGRRDACHLDPAVRPALRQSSLGGAQESRA